ncbi:NAD(P)-dependent oxidoreductase [Candidatus Poribacteria bacterium]|nr:NAD(P)-dependent oxidoreductase [Candidatus Poribacteria bacterium]
MRILITGAGGRVGTEVCHDLAKYYQLRLLDVRPIPLPRGEVLQGSVSDWETVKHAVAGMEAVVHLAIHNPGEQRCQAYHEYIQTDVDVGVKGTDMLLYAAKKAGVRRFVYTSSLNVYSACYPKKGDFLKDSDETLSAEHYGTIKWLAEELCRHYALRQGLSTIVLRFNSVTFPKLWASQGRDLEHPDYACTRVHIDDVVRAVHLAIEKDNIQWGRCLISGANPEKRYDTSTAEKLLGFRARYGFAAGKMYRDGILIDNG